MKYILGASAGFHDGAVSLINDRGEILFAAHSERYSKLKNDSGLSIDLLRDLPDVDIDVVSWYERPWLHNLQQWISGQKCYGPWTVRSAVRQHLSRDFKRTQSYPHHLSHAAAGFQTSGFDKAAVVVIDAVGELDTVSIYRAWYDSQNRARYRRLWRQKYPHSIGLFYSAVTKRVGLRAMDEEYITMGMAAYGNNFQHRYMSDRLIRDSDQLLFRDNLHTGIAPSEFAWMSNTDIAACAQTITENLIAAVMEKARLITGISDLVYCGGVALNCLANRNLGQWFDRVWIMPNPGDAGSSLGAAALALGKPLQWRDAFLGHEIPGPYPVEQALQHLQIQGIVGVASGRAEFGPRALGNRSLLADPRVPDMRDRVNAIKRRQSFRPFAPVILEEHVNGFFEMPRAWATSAYMQTVAKVRDPSAFPAICHVDGTARVQTVPRDQSGIRKLLEAWYQHTQCPMLLNTSLNIRGEPMVNDRSDADRFQKIYGVTVVS